MRKMSDRPTLFGGAVQLVVDMLDKRPVRRIAQPRVQDRAALQSNPGVPRNGAAIRSDLPPRASGSRLRVWPVGPDRCARGLAAEEEEPWTAATATTAQDRPKGPVRFAITLHLFHRTRHSEKMRPLADRDKAAPGLAGDRHRVIAGRVHEHETGRTDRQSRRQRPTACSRPWPQP